MQPQTSPEGFPQVSPRSPTSRSTRRAASRWFRPRTRALRRLLDVPLDVDRLWAAELLLRESPPPEFAEVACGARGDFGRVRAELDRYVRTARSSPWFYRTCEHRLLERCSYATAAGRASEVLYTMHARRLRFVAGEFREFHYLHNHYRVSPATVTGVHDFVLLRSPRWVYDFLAGPACRLPSSQRSSPVSGRPSSVGPACEVSPGVDMDVVRSLWDPDPGQLFFDVRELVVAAGEL